MVWRKGLLNKYLVEQENEDCIDKLDSEVVVIKAQDCNKDIETNTCSISIPDNIVLSQTTNLPAKLMMKFIMCWCKSNFDW